ncbi:PilZ domain-containing protein [Alkalimarinus sediminis]|uniref:PilZ domain-containing protein n=1 Tax=Alkalimarinus sediminis TaxID=1632866 RepID=A0A9E8HJH4_9ALTE|nr:PilZ domain-containing protein [Alkalimarinus sediminis]UZW75534.1 PilZ domain-containing protein [Alkalimarinus sediminis]
MDTGSTKKNLRHYTRIRAQLEANVLKNDETLVTVNIANLSRAGMMFACDNAALNAMMPNTTAIIPRKPVQLTVQFTVPVVATQTVMIKALCNIVYTRRLSRDSFQVGLEFDSVENNGYSYIEQYIDAQQQAG